MEFQDWRKKVFKRDDYTCLLCRKRGVYLEAHHIKRVIDYPELSLDTNNGTTLCRPCHNKTKGKEALYEDTLRVIMEKEKQFSEKGGKFITEDCQIT